MQTLTLIAFYLVLAFSPTGSPVCDSIEENGKTAVREEPTPSLNTTAAEIYYFHPDHLGSSAWVTDTTGHAVQHLGYLPWGERYISQKTGNFSTIFTFSGKERDEETGYSYFGQRFYYSQLSIWLSADPMRGKYPSLTPYNYCGNNPIKLIDPNGLDPIYAKNFWGFVKTIGDDGKKSTGAYLVRGSIARAVKKATKAGEFYTGDLSESQNVIHIPTGQIQQDVQQTVTATINSGSSPETRVEYGGHTLKGDKTARIWDAGYKMQTKELDDGRVEHRWTITPFKIGGKENQVGGPVSDIQFFWHVQPNGSKPSDKDKSCVQNLYDKGFTGTPFLIDANNRRVVYFNEKGSLLEIDYYEFKRMGNQEQLK